MGKADFVTIKINVNGKEHKVKMEKGGEIST